MFQVPLTSVVRVNWYGRCFGQRIMLTTGYIKEAGAINLSVQTEMNALIDEMLVGGQLDILGTYMALLPADYALEKITAQVVQATRFSMIQRNVTTNGTHAAAATVANDSACITLSGELAGARNRSNKHIGPIPDAASASGLLQPGYVALLSALGAKLVTTLILPAGAETYVPCVINTPPIVGVGVLDRHTVGPQSRVQRRRTVGLGE